ncbi:Putative A1 cistron-splicing factor, AAR2, AAR2 domain superfamily [Septoria linicola]|uniref:A1 cistron-splicing factor, AAR2, AAR2 domain superfamily n=1 Tax=Septoria linicola TaxID=215465 RepID=A0A9Q9B0N0_9PEZI|nr:Putative A1 cistron-splicing factor, AAR2, AAR2 domain superfamily [Septoria linicola]
MESADSPVLLLLDLPPSALGGIDLLSFTVTPRFRGVKDLPPGLHFSFAGTSTAFSERHGIWFRVPGASSSSDHLFITRWDAAAEMLKAETDDAEKLRWKANLGSIWKEGLTPYRQTSTDAKEDAQEEISDWPALISAITPSVLSKITSGDANNWYLTSASSARRDIEDIPGLDENDKTALQADKELNFLPVDLKKTWREGATGRERTEAAQDRSWALTHLVEDHCTDGDINEIVGELQFCFLMILTINNFSCLEQWKRLLTLVFTCKSAISDRPDFFIKAIAALRLQLQHCKDAEGGLIDLADEGGSLLKTLLSRFRSGLEGSTGTDVSDVADELDDLEDYLRQEHGWTFGGAHLRSGVLELEDGEQLQMESTAYDEDDETGEYAPQIVDLTPEQARLLNITPDDARKLGMDLSKASLNGPAQEVVESDENSEDEFQQPAASDDEEETQDLEDMDSRY